MSSAGGGKGGMEGEVGKSVAREVQDMWMENTKIGEELPSSIYSFCRRTISLSSRRILTLLDKDFLSF